jgi:hypothetical protein
VAFVGRPGQDRVRDRGVATAQCGHRQRDGRLRVRLQPRRRLGALLPEAELRLREDGESYVTDEGHFILDCTLPGDADLESLDRSRKQLPGVVEHGLLNGLAAQALLGRPDGEPLRCGAAAPERAAADGPD